MLFIWIKSCETHFHIFLLIPWLKPHYVNVYCSLSAVVISSLWVEVHQLTTLFSMRKGRWGVQTLTRLCFGVGTSFSFTDHKIKRGCAPAKASYSFLSTVLYKCYYSGLKSRFHQIAPNLFFSNACGQVSLSYHPPSDQFLSSVLSCKYIFFFYLESATISVYWGNCHLSFWGHQQCFWPSYALKMKYNSYCCALFFSMIYSG